MSLGARLKRAEEEIRRKTTDFGPMVVIVDSEEEEEETMKQLKAKYFENYEPRLVIVRTKEEEGKPLTIDEIRVREELSLSITK